ncbi:MAG: hypothetical protein RIS88_2098 [Pseudomonadota bacterium]|jgi:hypothetical protein
MSHRTALLLASVFAALIAAPARADKGGACHFHGSTPAKQETVLQCATQRKDMLAGTGKIEASWKSAPHEKIEQVEGKKGKEWKVTFRNPQAVDKDKQALYVFLSVPGNVLAANFTGK